MICKHKCRILIERYIFFAFRFHYVSSPAHVQLGYCNGDVVDGQSSLQEQVLAHVGERTGRVDRVPAHAVPLQVGGGIPTLDR